MLNGVKQGGVLSPVLFCVYIDDLLHTIARSKEGCYIGQMFVGVLAYADDIVLLAPTASAMRQMLRLCEEFAEKFSVLFNPSKSKCIVCESSSKRKLGTSSQDVAFTLGGSVIDVVDNWLHLGHIVSSDLDDTADISRSHNKLVTQINSVLCTFSSLDAIVKVKLLKSYCLSLYGCELWNLSHTDIGKICKSWRFGLRRVWSLPSGCRSTILQLLSDSIPLYDLICQRSVMFIKRCLCSESAVVQYVANYGMMHGHMKSLIGRNLVTSSEHFNISVYNLVNAGFNGKSVKSLFVRQVLPDFYSRTLSILELLMIRRGLLYVGTTGVHTR